eukprot:EST44223.1 Glycosyl hydrolase family 20 protein [Spironucleus salmonicida]
MLLLSLCILPQPQKQVLMPSQYYITSLTLNPDTKYFDTASRVFEEFVPAIFPKGKCTKDSSPVVLYIKYNQHDSEDYYSINVEKKSIILDITSVSKLSLALSTLAQLISAPIDQYYEQGIYTIQEQILTDSPQSDFRSLKIDSATHFLPVVAIKRQILAAALAKMNIVGIVLGNEYAVAVETTLKNSSYYMGKKYVHSKKDLQSIINYGNLLGISIYFEIDFLKASEIISKSKPEILADCTKNFLLHPFNTHTYEVITEIVQAVQPELMKYFHIGNSENVFSCWKEDAMINQYVQQHQITFKDLHKAFIQNITDIIKNIAPNSIIIQYQEALESQIEVDLIEAESSQITNTNAFHSFNFQLALSTPGKYRIYWQDTYLDFLAQNTTKNCAYLDGKFTDEGNLDQRIWPRASAISEISWSGKQDINQAEIRNFSCYLRYLGVKSGLVGTGKPCMGE